jgi:hypothetical protein
MSFFCRLFGHTWVPETRAPEVRWNTTKEGHVLTPTVDERPVTHVEVCVRCRAERAAGPRRHDGDRPLVAFQPIDGRSGSDEEAASA